MKVKWYGKFKSKKDGKETQTVETFEGKNMKEINEKKHALIDSMVTWDYELEDQEIMEVTD